MPARRRPYPDREPRGGAGPESGGGAGPESGEAANLESEGSADVDVQVESVAEAVFSALADPTRRAILAELAAAGPATATDLAGRLPISRQAIGKHLALLDEAGLVRGELGERRRVRFHLKSGPMSVAQSFLAALARDWDGQLVRLRQHLDRST